MRAAIAAALVVASASVAAADPVRAPELRVGLGAGHATGPDSWLGAPEGVALGAMFDAGWWISPDVTFGVHAGWGAFQNAIDDSANFPRHSEWRHSYLQTHATFLWHYKRVVAGGGLGVDVARETLLETDGMERSETDQSFHLGVHLQIGADVVRVGPGTLGAFAIATAQPIQIDARQSEEITSVIAGVSYAFDR